MQAIESRKEPEELEELGIELGAGTADEACDAETRKALPCGVSRIRCSSSMRVG